MKRVTIKDVALKSGTSVRTVSRVLNHEPYVKDETRERVLQAIAELGFTANLAARRLKEKQTHQIVVFIDQRKGRYWGLYHNEFFEALHRYAKRKGYRLLLSASSPDSFLEDENDGFYLVKQGFCDGAILFDPQVDDQRVLYLQEYDVPFILMSKGEQTASISYVDLDNVAAGRLAAEYMANRGYKRLSFLTGNQRSVVNRERMRGFAQFCERQFVSCAIITGLNDLQAVYQHTRQALAAGSGQAFFVSGDERALGVYRAVQEQGLKIGEDIGVLGIDNLEMGKYLFPSLTTIDQPKEKMAAVALQILLSQIEENSGHQQMMVEPKVIERQSI